MKKINILLLVGLAGLIAVVWGPQLARWMRSVPNLTRYPLGPRFYCESCGWHFDESPRLLPPLTCPKCKKPTAMKTIFSPSAAAPEFIRCKKCQANIPFQLFKWPPEEKGRWEKRLGELREGEFLRSDEMSDLQKTKLVKTSALEWMKWDDFMQLCPPKPARCAVRNVGTTTPLSLTIQGNRPARRPDGEAITCSQPVTQRGRPEANCE